MVGSPSDSPSDRTIVRRLRTRLAARTPTRYDASDAPFRSAVAVVIREGRRPELLMIRRTERESDPWSGHMAFPGGRRDPEDPDDVATALRETHEEVGLDLASRGAFVGALDDLPTLGRLATNRLVVAPLVFELRDPEAPVELDVDRTEVAEAIWVPVDRLESGEANAEFKYRKGDLEMLFPAFDHEGRIIWGVSYRILTTLLEILALAR